MELLLHYLYMIFPEEIQVFRNRRLRYLAA